MRAGAEAWGPTLAVIVRHSLYAQSLPRLLAVSFATAAVAAALIRLLFRRGRSHLSHHWADAGPRRRGASPRR